VSAWQRWQRWRNMRAIGLMTMEELLLLEGRYVPPEGSTYLRARPLTRAELMSA
jgi:hypothetical protein